MSTFLKFLCVLFFVFPTGVRAEEAIIKANTNSNTQAIAESMNMVNDENSPEQIFAQMSNETPSGTSQKPNFTERPEDQLYIVEVVARNDVLLSSGMQIYFDDTNLLLPLSALAEALEFPIKIDISSGVANGWFVTPDNSFSLTPPYKEVTIAGKKIAVKGMVEHHIDDIYVTLSDVQNWFPLKFEFKFNELRLNITPTVDMPFEQKAQRQQRWERLKNQAQIDLQEKNNDDIIFLPYKKWSAPSVQVTHNVGATKNDAGVKNSFITNIQANNDFLGHSARFGASLNTGDIEVKGLNTLNFQMSKEDYRANLLGPMRATEYAFGDVDVSSFPLADGALRGRGIRLSNAPANFIRDINNFSVRGIAPVGWDVELYSDEQIIDFSKIGSDGRYDFEDIDLREGFNSFRVVLYGPNGEREERFERFYLGQNMVEKGGFIYNVSGLQSTAPVFNFDDRPEESGMLSAVGEYGLTDKMSFYGGVYSGLIGGVNHNALGTGLRLSSSRFYTQISSLVTDKEAWSAGLTTTGNLTDNITVGAGYTKHQNYKKQERGAVQDIYARFSHMLSFKLIQLGSYGFEVRNSLSDTGVRTDSVSNRISGNFLGLNLSNEVKYSRNDTANNEPVVDGNLTARYRNRLGLWRARLNYAADDRETLQSGEIGLQASVGKNVFLNLDYNAQFLDPKEKTFSASLDREFEKFKIGFQGAITSEDEIRLGLALTYNIVPKSLFGDYVMTGSTQALYNGRLEVLPYIDANQDGVFNEGEKLVPGVTLQNKLRGEKAVSDEYGVALIDKISPSDVNVITVDVETLPDIYMAPGNDQLRIFGRQGFFGPLYYPINIMGEISGTLSANNLVVDQQTDEPETAVANISLMLIDANDKVIAETFSEYDGFFTFQSVPLGEYRLYIPPSSAVSNFLKGQSTSQPIILDAEQSEINTLQITLGENGMNMTY